uniref:alpha/beta hydrolase n=1 Tax=Kroppenstedtia sanguinis TaxID=1380684 RepID=UPI003D1B0501
MIPEECSVTWSLTESCGVVLPRTHRRLMCSHIENRSYRILVAVPEGEPPPEGYPVFYLLDANAVFATMVEAMRVQSGRSEKTGAVPAVIVGIGYPTDQPFSPDRFYDFTYPISREEQPLTREGKAWPRCGGAENFLSFIEEELKPEIEDLLPIDKANQAIVGHSLGGLFVLQVLLNRPEAFRTYVAGSPSIHWDWRRLQEQERRFADRLERKPIEARVLIAVGELEKNHPSRMYENAQELSGRLGAFSRRGVYTEFEVFAKENHGSVLPILVSRSLRFAHRPGDERRHDNG